MLRQVSTKEKNKQVYFKSFEHVQLTEETLQ